MFQAVSEEIVLSDLFGGMISALNIFAENISEGGITSFTFERNRFVVIKDRHFMFVSRSDIDQDVRELKDEMKQIVKKFFLRFPARTLKNWKGGNTGMFSGFKNDLHEI